MKLWKKILLTVILILVLTVAILLIWQGKNIKALLVAMTSNSSDIESKLEENSNRQRQLFDEHSIVVSPPSIQQSEDLFEGNISADDLKEALGLNTHLDSDISSDSNFSQDIDSSDLPDADSLTEEELVNQCVADLYSYKVDLMASLSSLLQSALSEWKALPAEERTNAKKTEIGLAGLEKCYELEAQADGNVQNLLAEYKVKLEAIGADASVLNTLWDYYCDEKAAEKAYYLSKYLG